MRLIDADEIPYITTYREDWLNNTSTEDQCAWKSNIDAMPTIEERKKGRWNIKLIRPVYGGVTFRVDARCSECGVFIAQTTAHRKMTYWFCPFCGADMRGEDDGGRES